MAIWNDFESSRLVKAGEAEKEDFTPASDVGTTTGYGMQVYQKIGLVDEPDLLRLTGLTAKMLKKKQPTYKSTSLKLDGPEGPSTVLYPISLKGLPQHEISGMLKAKLYHDVFVTHSERVLRAETQLTQAQGGRLFSVCATGLSSNKPSLKEHAKVLTVEEMSQIKEQLDAEKAMSEKAFNEITKPDSETEEDEEEVPQFSKGGGKRKAKTFSLGSLGKAGEAKVKAKAKAKASLASKVASKMQSLMAQPGQPSVSKSAAIRDASPVPSQVSRSSKPGKAQGTKKDRLVEEAVQLLGHDEMLLRVAKRHLMTQKGSSTKCLANLSVVDIFAGSKPGQSLNGDRGSKTRKHARLLLKPVQLVNYPNTS